MTPDTLDILTNKEVIAVDQDPLGMQGRKVWDNGPQEVWMKPLADGSRAVILFNRGTEAGTITVNWEDIGLFPGGQAMVRDLWKKADEGMTTGRYRATVGAHGVVMMTGDAAVAAGRSRGEAGRQKRQANVVRMA